MRRWVSETDARRKHKATDVRQVILKHLIMMQKHNHTHTHSQKESIVPWLLATHFLSHRGLVLKLDASGLFRLGLAPSRFGA